MTAVSKTIRKVKKQDLKGFKCYVSIAIIYIINVAKRRREKLNILTVLVAGEELRRRFLRSCEKASCETWT
jgi:hypothetical protein